MKNCEVRMYSARVRKAAILQAECNPKVESSECSENGKCSVRRSREVSVEVSEKDGIRSLHLGSETVQSSMRLADPTELVLSYTRA